MIYEKVDLYRYFGIERGEQAEGYLTAYVPDPLEIGRASCRERV